MPAFGNPKPAAISTSATARAIRAAAKKDIVQRESEVPVMAGSRRARAGPVGPARAASTRSLGRRRELADLDAPRLGSALQIRPGELFRVFGLDLVVERL